MSRINVQVIRHYASMYVKRFSATIRIAEKEFIPLTFTKEGTEIPITFLVAENEEVSLTYDGGYH